MDPDVFVLKWTINPVMVCFGTSGCGDRHLGHAVNYFMLELPEAAWLQTYEWQCVCKHSFLQLYIKAAYRHLGCVYTSKLSVFKTVVWHWDRLTWNDLLIIHYQNIFFTTHCAQWASRLTCANSWWKNRNCLGAKARSLPVPTIPRRDNWVPGYIFWDHSVY